MHFFKRTKLHCSLDLKLSGMLRLQSDAVKLRRANESVKSLVLFHAHAQLHFEVDPNILHNFIYNGSTWVMFLTDRLHLRERQNIIFISSFTDQSQPLLTQASLTEANKWISPHGPSLGAGLC